MNVILLYSDNWRHSAWN